MTDSLFESNAAKWGGAAKIASRGTHHVEFSRSTFQKNTAYSSTGSVESGSGGALQLAGGSLQHPILIRNSTFSENTSYNLGSALAVDGFVSLLNSTITANQVEGAVASVPAAIHNLTSLPGSLTLQNTIVADNLGSDLGGTQISSTTPETCWCRRPRGLWTSIAGR